MGHYVNRNCPICGGYMESRTDGDICTNCGYCLPGNTSITETNTTDKTYQKAEGLVHPKENIGGLYGWICPKCGAVMSPYTSFCPNCTQRNFEITCTTATDPTNITLFNTQVTKK